MTRWALLGRRPDGESTEGSLRVYRWNLNGGAHSGISSVPVLNITVGADGTAEAVSTTSTAFATPGGSGVGLSLRTFKEGLGSAYRGYTDSAGLRHLRFDTAGLDLTYDIRGAGLTTICALNVFKPAAAMPGPAPSILPGVGIEPVRLGMSADEAIRAMGRPPQLRRPDVLIWVLNEKDTFGGRLAVGVAGQQPRLGLHLHRRALLPHRAGERAGDRHPRTAGRVWGGLPELPS